MVEAFNNIAAGHVQSLSRPAGAPDRTYLPIAGDNADAKAAVTAFLDSIGYAVIDTGRLADGWRQEIGTPVFVAPYGPADGDGTPAARPPSAPRSLMPPAETPATPCGGCAARERTARTAPAGGHAHTRPSRVPSGTLPEPEKTSPDHDAAACHHAMTGGIGVLVEDAGYHSEANLQAPGPDRLIADAKTRDLARRQPAEGPPAEDATAVQANAHRLATPAGRALDKRRAPDVEGLHASLKYQGGLRRFSLRGLGNVTGEFLFAGMAHNLRLPAAIS